MTKIQILISQVSYAMGVMGYDYNPAVIYDTVRQLNRFYGKKLTAMVNCCEDDETPTLGEVIMAILIDTYSAETV